MTRHSFSGNAVPNTLNGSITSGATSFSLSSAPSGWPNTAIGPFVVTIDKGVTGLEEKILCASISGSTVTVASGGRGYDGSTAVGHSSNATVNHTLDATQFDLHDAFVAGNGTVTPSTSAIGDIAADGTSAFPAAADHKHAREQFATGASSTSAVGDSPTDGTSVSPAHADHKHGREAFGTSSTTSAVTDTQSAGTAATPAHSDHVHGREGWATGATTTSKPGDAAADGTSSQPARADHKHGRESAAGDVLGIARITSPAYSVNVGTYAVMDGTNAKITVTVPASGNLLLSMSGIINATTTTTYGKFIWSNVATNGSGLISNAAETGSLTNGAYKNLEWYVTGQTPGASLTCYLQWCYSNNSGTVQYISSTDLILLAIAL